MEQADRLKLHYYLLDRSHLIDAFVRNKCEAQVISIAKDIIATLGLDVEVLAEPSGEGGFSDWWKFIGKNDKQLTLISVILALILSRVPVSNHELENLQKRSLEMDTTEKSLNIEKLKRELKKSDIEDSSIDEAVSYFESNIKVIKHKSNFYQSLQTYSNVEKISTSVFRQKKEVITEKIVERKDFHKFILTSNDLPPLPVEDAIIEIAAPVVIHKKYKWKGIYEGKPIDFAMNDDEYRKSVLKGEVVFHDEFYISCKMSIKRQVDEFGIIQTNGYTVETVLGKVEDKKIIETEQGKRYKRIKKDIEGQTQMWDNEE
jgi:hypothetical protein